MTAPNRQFPVREPIIDSATGLVSDRWRIYFRDQQQTIDSQPSMITPPIVASTQNASIGTTPIPTDDLPAGLYNVWFYAEVTTVAGVTSSLIVVVGFTNNGLAKTFTSTNMNGNTTTTVNSQGWTFHIDAGTPISYSTTYASNPAGAMFYNLWVILTKVAND